MGGPSPALELVDSVEELRQVADDPEGFLEKLMSEAGGPVVYLSFLILVFCACVRS